MEKDDHYVEQSRQFKEDYHGDETKSSSAIEDEEDRRNLRWILFAKSKLSFGFHHLGPSKVPKMTDDRRGMCICFEKISGWSIPKNVLKAFGGGNYEITAQLSLSMFHLPSNTFFGTTWMGPTISLGNNYKKVPDVVDFDYSDIVYMISRLADPACFVVIEIVVSKIDSEKNFVLSQFGCGWTMLNLFSKPYPPDIADDRDKIKLLSCSIFAGSPRDLIVNSDISKLSGKLKEISDCSLFFRLFSHRKLLNLQGLVSENEAIGRFDQIAGLITREIILPKCTRPELVSCLGHDESIDDNSNIYFFPARPRLAVQLTLKIANCQLFIPRRDSLELKIIEGFCKDHPHISKSDVHILQRSLKIGLHNGHTLINNNWSVEPLIEDKEDRDILLTTDAVVSVLGYVADVYMAVSFVVEYEVGINSHKNNHFDSKDVLSTGKSPLASLSGTVILGSAIFIPYNGTKVLLSNNDRQLESADGVNIEIKLFKDETCNIFSPSPLVSDLDVGFEKLDVTAQSKPKERLSYIDEKKQPVTKFNHSRVQENEDLTPMLGFDLRLFHPVDGEIKKTDNIRSFSKIEDFQDRDDYETTRHDLLKESNFVLEAEKKFQLRESTVRRESGDENESVNDSLVAGDSQHSSVRIDKNFYSYNTKTRALQFTPRNETGIAEQSRDDLSDITDHISLPGKPREKMLSQLFGNAMNVKLNNPSKSAFAEPTFIGLTNDKNSFRIAPKTTIPIKPNEHFVKEMSRGAKSRLNRHGIQDAIADSSFRVPLKVQGELSKINRRPIDINVELGDELLLQEISLQFVGFRRQNEFGSEDSPRAVYFTFQFYTCPSTRTESLKLLPANGKEVNVLVRDNPQARDEPPLTLRFIVDCSKLSPMEGVEFSEYLAHKSLYIDVWDADALMQIGTIGIPLRMLLRQGAPLVKQSLECDVINSEISAVSDGGITSLVVMENGPVSGDIVGSVSIVMSNVGGKGKGPHNPNQIEKNTSIVAPMEGLNWRAHNNDDHTISSAFCTKNPKKLVLAKPLSEKSPELSRALQDIKKFSSGTSFRSLSSVRGINGNSTLNYDEVVMIFKRFQGNVKGTVQYVGDLMLLLDVPSWPIILRKVVRMFRAHADKISFKTEILRFASAAEEINVEELQECFRSMSKMLQLKFSSEELILGAQKIVQDINQSGNKNSDSNKANVVTVKQLVEFIQSEADRADWAKVQNHFQLCAQNAELQGMDVHEVLADYDVKNSFFLSVRNFRDFLIKISSYGKLTIAEITLMCRYFGGRNRDFKTASAYELDDERDPISLKEVMASIGKEYFGNTQTRVQAYLSRQFSAEENVPLDEKLNVKYILRLLNQGDVKDVYYFSYSQVEGLFKSLGICTQLSHNQILSIIKKLDVKRNQQVPITAVLSYLGISYKASDIPSEFVIPTQANPVSKDVPVDAEYLLRMLLEKVQTYGVAMDQAFRHFDTNGDGQISMEELQAGLRDLGIFSHIPNWEKQIPHIVKKFDSSGDGMVSIKEFFQFLGIKEYVPNVIQRLTKIFAIAVQKGLSFKDIFLELDENKNGSLDAQEIILGCKKLGTFQELAMEDANSVIKEFDKNSDGHISLDEFIKFFTIRIEQFQKSVRKKNLQKIIQRFREVITTARDKGGITIRDIFGHLDKDKGGSLSIQELSQSLRALPNFKSISDQDIQDLTAAIDTDKSGDISADEFEQFILGDKLAESSSSNNDARGGASDSDIIARIKKTFKAALDNGLPFDKMFSLMDKDKSRSLSLSELDSLLRRIPSFKEITSNEVRILFDAIDKDKSGLISLEEFEFFVCSKDSLKKPTVVSSSNKQAESKREETKQSEAKREETKQTETNVSRRSAVEVKELFIRHMRRISEIDGSVRALLAYLDDDEDGLISKERLFSLLRRENVFESLTEEELNVLLTSCYYEPLRGTTVHKGSVVTDKDAIDVGCLLRLLEGQQIIQKDYLEDTENDFSSGQNKDYQFSTNLELKLVEKKLRSFGHSLAKKGVDVESEFRSYDVKVVGHVSRTDFIKVLSKLGIYLLEEGKILNEEGRNGTNEDSSTVRKLQLQQMERLKTSSNQVKSYVQNIPKLARKLFQYDVNNGSEFKNHLESLTIIDWYRQGQKQMLLQQVLSHSLMHTLLLYPRFGKTLFFEYPIHNPFNHEERFEIEVQDPELRLVTSYEEWLCLRKLCRPCIGELGLDPVEADMFDCDGNGKVQVTLLPNETLYIPFTYLTLVPYNPSHRSQYRNNNDIDGAIVEPCEDAGENHERSIDVKIISATHGHIVSVLNVQLHPRPFIINRVLRFQEYENSIAKRRIQLIGIPNNDSSYLVRTSHSDLKFVHCVENTRNQSQMSRVAVEWGSDQYDDTELLHSLNLLIRYRCMEATGMGMFYLLIYNDPYQSQLHEVWQIMVHSRLRLDIHGVIGNNSLTDLVLRGDKQSRRVRAFGGVNLAAQKISFRPESVFQLVPGAYNRVVMNVHPRKLGCHRALVNVVDIDSRVLLSSWLVSVQAQSPAVMRIYDVEVSVGQVLYKKILFKNLWDSHRKYTLMSSDEQLMRARTTSVEIGPQGAAYIRLWFNTWIGDDNEIKDVYLFLNDQETGQNEECNLFRIRQAG